MRVAPLNNKRLIDELTQTLEGSVSQKDYTAALMALFRCRELLERVRPELNKKKEIHKEIGIYLGILNGLLEDTSNYPTAYLDSPEWRGPYDFLRKKNIVPNG